MINNFLFLPRAPHTQNMRKSSIAEGTVERVSGGCMNYAHLPLRIEKKSIPNGVIFVNDCLMADCQVNRMNRGKINAERDWTRGYRCHECGGRVCVEHYDRGTKQCDQCRAAKEDHPLAYLLT
jgi:hypothetical protein